MGKNERCWLRSACNKCVQQVSLLELDTDHVTQGGRVCRRLSLTNKGRPCKVHVVTKTSIWPRQFYLVFWNDLVFFQVTRSSEIVLKGPNSRVSSWYLLKSLNSKLTKKAKISGFYWQKIAVFSGFFLSKIGGYPSSPSPNPLTKNHSDQKSLAEVGGTPPQWTKKGG